MRYVILIIAALAALRTDEARAERFLVRDQAQFREATETLSPGDEVVLANGEWRDFQVLFEGRGLADRPITLRAETPGGVVLTGQSNLRLSGEYLLVSGLVFRDGHSPTDEVIAFRRDSRRTASHSRVTQVVIDRFNQPDRRTEDIWVAIYGQDNRVDHSHFEGKSNAGVTLAVIRPRGNSQPNRHRIDHNYFGPRPNLGSNGGETVRIGTSEESLSDSNSIIESNFFDRCDGEVEIVSNKSGGNIFRGNVFHESRGALVLRHGSGNLVEGNVFFGNGKAHTGGIRVINPRQTVRHNYMEGLAGTGFASAITVMNGVPDSPINRYHQVVGAVIQGNSVIDSRRITLAAGADEERSAPPVDTRFERNLIFNESGDDPFRAEGDIGGITFAGNVQNPVRQPLLQDGFQRRELDLARAANGLLYPTGAAAGAAGVPRSLQPIRREQTGVAWYPKNGTGTAAFGSGARTEVTAGASLARAVAMASSGDTIRLGPGAHFVDAPLAIGKTLTITGPAPQGEAILRFGGRTLFEIAEGGRLHLTGLTVSGDRAPRAPGNAVIRAAARPMLANYAIVIEDSRFGELDGSPDFDVVATSPSALADSIDIKGSRFERVSGAVVDARGAGEDSPLYSAEQVRISRSEFREVGAVVDLRRGGRDESTFGPIFSLTDSVVVESGRLRGASVRLSGVQVASIERNRFVDSAPIEVTHSVGTPQTLVAGNLFARTPPVVLRELYAPGPPRAVLRGNRTEAVQ
ncbi:polysaccharide lyase 6 family protein [Sphingosinicella sp. CPCC 101087]|uniref:polysaccharide lyase 6 family protein n=1 Tax=Sphingosinicella sp. CPCC 101087 TaxID=2497754 RepID=UPI001FB1885C|nr:polysaccharide lyase 6 family protein [Sphingosinicella sp. CPCC 101087]